MVDSYNLWSSLPAGFGSVFFTCSFTRTVGRRTRNLRRRAAHLCARSGLLLAHRGRADATSSLSRYSSGCPWLIFQKRFQMEKFVSSL